MENNKPKSYSFLTWLLVILSAIGLVAAFISTYLTYSAVASASGDKGGAVIVLLFFFPYCLFACASALVVSVISIPTSGFLLSRGLTPVSKTVNKVNIALSAVTLILVVLNVIGFFGITGAASA